MVHGPCKYTNPHSIISHLHAIAHCSARFNSGFLSLDMLWTMLGLAWLTNTYLFHRFFCRLIIA